jgi:hypothetical protein
VTCRFFAFLVALVLCGVGCAPSLPASFSCTQSGQCVSGGVAGVCETTGACSFPDVTCASGRRYGALGPPPYAGACSGMTLDGGAGMITRVGTSTRPSGPPAGGVALAAPAGVAAGDLLWASVFTDDSAATVIAPSGWMQHATLGGGGLSFRASWFFKSWQAGDPSSFTFTLSGGSPSFAAGGLVAYRGVNGTMPIDTSTNATFLASAFTAPSITTSHANDMLLAMFVNATSASLPLSPPSGMSPAVQLNEIGMFDQVQAAAGPTGARTALLNPDVPGLGAVDYVALAPTP